MNKEDKVEEKGKTYLDRNEIAKMYESLKQNKACAVDTDNNTRRITLERKLDLIYTSSNRDQFFQYLLTVSKYMN